MSLNQTAHANMTASEMAELIVKAPPGNWPQDWAKWDCTRDAFLILLERAIANLPPYPENKYSGKGIVISVSAKPGYSSGKNLPHGYFPGAWVLVKELRRLGCTLPITFAYMGFLEWDLTLTRLMESLGVECIDLREIERNDPRRPRILAGWESKCYSVIHSRYEEVLFLDADNIAQLDPGYLFNSTQYKYYGAVFWPDVPPQDRAEWLPECVWKNVGLTYRDEVDFESGQFMVNKKKCWREINLSMWLNEHSDYFYKFIFGDKSTYHLAWVKLDANWAMPMRGAGGNGGSLFQHDFEGRILFQHCTRCKPDLNGYSSPGHLRNPNQYQAHIQELRTLWGGRLWWNSNPSEKEIELQNSLTGKIFTYTREGLDSRDIRLLEDNRIGRGLAKMEVSWNVFCDKEPIMIISSLENTPTAFLKREQNNNWEGYWLEHERCKVTLVMKDG